MFSCKIVAKVAAIKHKTVCMQKTKTIYLLVIWSILLILNLAPVEFIMILVSCPQYTTKPRTQSVFRRELPLNKRLSLLNPILFRSSF